MARELTTLQRRFVELYEGNARAAARAAGYAEGPGLAKVGSQLLANPLVRKALIERGKLEADERADAEASAIDEQLAKVSEDRRELARSLVESRAARLAFLAGVAVNPALEWKERIRAVETIGKVKGDFIERVQLEAGGSLEALVLEAQRRGRELEEEEAATVEVEGKVHG